MKWRRKPIEVEARDKGNGWWEVNDPVHGWFKVLKSVFERDYEPLPEPVVPKTWKCRKCNVSPRVGRDSENTKVLVCELCYAQCSDPDTCHVDPECSFVSAEPVVEPGEKGER